MLTLPLQVSTAPLQMAQQPLGAGVEQEGSLLADRPGLLRPRLTDGLSLGPFPIPGAQLGVEIHEILAVQSELGHGHRGVVRAQLTAQQALQGVGSWGAHIQVSRTQEQGPWPLRAQTPGGLSYLLPPRL